MKRICKPFGFIVFLVFISSSACQSARISKAQQKSDEDALKTVAQAVIGKEMSDQELETLTKQLQTDPEAQSAAQTIKNSLANPSIQAKYCPVDGKRYAARVKICPVHHVELKSPDEQ